MKVRDSYDVINGVSRITEMVSSGLDIVADDGKTLFTIHLVDDGIEIATGGLCKHQGKVLDSPIRVLPIGRNRIVIEREVFEG